MERKSIGLFRTTKTTISISIPVEKPEEWIHFGFSFGIAPYYYEQAGGTALYTRVYEELFGWHNEKSYRSFSNYSFVGDFIQIIGADTNDEMLTLQLKIFEDAEGKNPIKNNIISLRLIAYNHLTGGFPPTRLTLPENDNLDKKCFFFGIVKDQCNAFAFLKNMKDTQSDYVSSAGYKTREQDSCFEINECKYCLDAYKCLAPQEGYNRQLNKVEVYNSKDVMMLSSILDEIQGNGGSARHVAFFDNKGNKYWVRCPESCKEKNIQFELLI